MDSSNPGIEEGLDGAVGVRGGAGVVRIVDHARRAGVDGIEHDYEIAYILSCGR